MLSRYKYILLSRYNNFLLPTPWITVFHFCYKSYTVGLMVWIWRELTSQISTSSRRLWQWGKEWEKKPWTFLHGLAAKTGNVASRKIFEGEGACQNQAWAFSLFLPLFLAIGVSLSVSFLAHFCELTHGVHLQPLCFQLCKSVCRRGGGEGQVWIGVEV